MDKKLIQNNLGFLKTMKQTCFIESKYLVS